MDDPRVAVLIPCFNTGPFLREAIESALVQTRPPDEIVVVDDGSTDDSAAIAGAFPEVRLVRQANRGLSAARNAALGASRSELVVFHDADDRLLPTAIEVGLRAMAARPECAFVFGFSRPIRADGSPLPAPRWEPVVAASYATLLAGHALVPPSCALFRRAAVEAVGGFRATTEPTEDYDCYLRIARAHAIFCHNEPVVEYRQHGANASAQSSARQMRSAFATLELQRPFVRGDPELEAALRSGRRHWAAIFGPGAAFEVLRSARRGQLAHATRTLALVLAHHPRSFASVARFRLDLLLGRQPSAASRPR